MKPLSNASIDQVSHESSARSAELACDLAYLRCPRCKIGPLERKEVLLCGNCGNAYPVVRGIPVLINDGHSVFATADYRAPAQTFRGNSYGKSTDSGGSLLRRAYHRFAGVLLNFAIARSHLDAEKALIRIQQRTRNANILVIGAGDERYLGSGKFFYTDVAFGKNTQIICDAHDLPFQDSFFDFVIAVAVLEHVADPNRCVEEMWRVLKPSGFVYAATPFLQAVHLGAYDFTRFTYLGHRRLFRHFEDEESGMALGPAAALAWSLQYFVTSLTDTRWLRNGLRLIMLLVSVPIKLLDHITRRHAAAIDGAAGVFFFGKKSERTISDRELIKLYRGAT